MIIDVILLLYLIYKLNVITGVHIWKKHSSYKLQYYL
jgi:hypothetical protein